MKNHIKLTLLSLFLVAAVACQPGKKPIDKQKYTNISTSGLTNDWLKDAVLYEVNIRQYTPEGTFDAFAEHLPRLKELGVDILWIMPVHPISKKNRKGSLGSYYAVADYKAINPEFGTMSDFKELVDLSHKMGFKVIIDWVANHTGWDNPWIVEHPEWYTTDSTGAIIPPNADWSDIADLNFDVQPMRRAMIDAMDFWLKETNIDGFRCDVAWGVPQDFWEDARASFDSIKSVYMLAEDEDHPEFLEKAFDSNYTWKLHHIINDVAKGEKTAIDIRSYFDEIVGTYPVGSFPMQFITNHDENSWAGSVGERLGDAAKTFAVFSFTVPGIPLIYSGQEAGLNKRLKFFEKDEIDWSNLELQDFYEKLVNLKTDNPALWNGENGGVITFLKTSHPEKILAYVREKNDNKVLVLLNLSGDTIVESLEFDVQQELDEVDGEVKLVIGEKMDIELHPWKYKIFISK